ncbi:MAG: para-aminobenzoate synthetase component, partial [Microbacteriaceae bacterium]|nr:para-aminobenzoate synthetase component [Microbacteriaceae bacterium]
MRRRVIRHLLGEWTDPAVAFSALYATADRAFWLDSGNAALGGRSYIGQGDRVVTASAAGAGLRFDPPGPTFDGSIFEFLAAEQSGSPGLVDPSAPTTGFQLGWVGWFGYELRSQTMYSPRPGRPRRSHYPDAAWLEVTRALEFDHSTQTVTLLALGEDWTGELG